MATLLFSILVYLYKTTSLEMEEDPKFDFKFQFKDQNQDMVHLFSEVASKPPEVEVNTTCLPPELIPAAQLNCNDQAFTKKHQKVPKKVVITYFLGFEIQDTLEIVLKEHVDVVDKIFIVEANYTHKGKDKPLLWDIVKKTQRFEFMPASKVIHVQIESHITPSSDIWVFENNSEKIASEKIRQILKSSDEFGDDDLIIFADIDEMISREVLHSLRHCELRHGVVAGAIIMPMGNFDLAFRSDFPVRGKPHSYGRATIVQMSLFFEGKHPGGRGVPGDYNVTGGVHLTRPSLPVTTLLKELTATSYSGNAKSYGLRTQTKQSIDQLQTDTYNFKGVGVYEGWRARCDDVNSISDMERYIPWYLDCNRDRFPYWFGKLDSRNKILYDSLQNYFNKSFVSSP